MRHGKICKSFSQQEKTMEIYGKIKIDPFMGIRNPKA